MNRLLPIVLLFTVAMLALPSVRADASQHPVKWSQLPNMQTGVDWNSMEGWYICADDFRCTDPRPVHDVHWWGSYWGGEDPQPIDGFFIRFFSNSRNDEEQFSEPGSLLYETYISGNCNEAFFGFSPYDSTNVYRYDCVLPSPFEQTLGEIYWLSVQVDLDWGGPPYWGWHNSINHWQEDAVQASDPEPWDWYPLVHPDGYSDDLAFQLTVIPEPPTVMLLWLAAIGGLMLVRRNKK